MRCMRVLLALTACAILAGCGGASYETLVEVETQKQANVVLVELARANITDTRVGTGGDRRTPTIVISVPNDQLFAARELLVRLNLPEQSPPGFDEMLAKRGFIPTETEERARLMHAVSGEISRTFEIYDDIVSARVHVVLPDETVFDPEQADQARPSALVVLKYRPSPHANDEAASTPLTVEQAQHMVADAVEGLNVEDVTVAFTPVVAPTITAAPATPAEVVTLVNDQVLLAIGASFGATTLLFGGLYLVERRRRQTTSPGLAAA